MEIDINNLPESLPESHQIILDLKKENTEYKQKYFHLLEELRLAKQHRFSPSSEKNVLQPDLFDEAGLEQITDEVKEDMEDELLVKAYTRKKHPVRKPLPSYFPREIVLHDIDDAEKICACGEHLVRIGEEISEQLKYIPAQIAVIQHVRPKYACKPCQGNVRIANMPVLLLPKSIATPELVAHTVIAKYCDHLPLYRQEAMWNRLDIHLPRSSLCGWVLKTAELCEPLIREMKKMIVTNRYTQADETTIQVLDEVGRDNTQKSYMWCYRGGELGHPSIVFDYQETRGGYHAQSFLWGFEGYLQTDAYSGYNWADKNKKIISVGCHAHARRPFAELVKLSKTPGLAHEAIKFYQKLYLIEKWAREKNLTHAQRHALRQEKSLPVLTEFKKWLDHHHLKTSEQGKIGKAIRYCLNHWNDLTNYLLDGSVEIDNNLTENVIRPFALGRKNWLFSGSPSGAKAGATLYSLIETCKANHIEPYAYFCAMLHQIRLCQSSEDYKNLLPQFIQL